MDQTRRHVEKKNWIPTSHQNIIWIKDLKYTNITLDLLKKKLWGNTVLKRVSYAAWLSRFDP